MYPVRCSKKFSRSMLLGLVALSTTGCATMKMPFGNKNLASQPKESKFADAASAGTGISGQFKSMGTAVSSAMGKAKNAVTSTFTSSSSSDDSDETSLANMPSQLSPELWVANGHLYETQGNFAKALDNYTKALESQPNNEAALVSTARLYSRQGQDDKAVDFFNKAIAVSPQAATYNELALIHQKLGSTAEAHGSITKAIELEPTNARYRNNLASMLVAGGRSDEAVKQLEQVFPPAVANYNVAYLHFSNSNVAAAQQHLQLALQADPNLQQARDLMDRLGGSQTTQAAMSAYGAANQIYRTAQGVAGTATVAQQVPYGQNAAPVQSNALPQATVGGGPAITAPGSLVPNTMAPMTPPAAATPSIPATGYPAPSFPNAYAPPAFGAGS